MTALVGIADSQRLAAVVVLGGLLLVILELVRRKHLTERYALLWLFATIVLLVFVVWRGLLTTLSYKVGIHYPPSALFAVALGLGLILLVHFSLAISRLAGQNTMLAQRLAILQQRLDEQEATLTEAGLSEPVLTRQPPAAGDEDRAALAATAEKLTRTG